MQFKILTHSTDIYESKVKRTPNNKSIFHYELQVEVSQNFKAKLIHKTDIGILC